MEGKESQFVDRFTGKASGRIQLSRDIMRDCQGQVSSMQLIRHLDRGFMGMAGTELRGRVRVGDKKCESPIHKLQSKHSGLPGIGGVK